jgi:tetratricopeptide (TPR) repeat protein
LEDALKISEDINDIVGSVLVSWGFGLALSWNCEFEKAYKHLRNALDINLAAKSVWGIAAMKSNLAVFYYNFSGKLNIGFKTTEETLLRAEESGDILSKAVAYGSHGISCYGKGFLKEAEKHLLKGAEFCEKINLVSYNFGAHFYLGETYFESEDFARSKEHYEKVISISENTQAYPSWAGLAKVGLARSEVMNKGKDVNLESLPVYSRNNKVKMLEGWVQRYLGEIFLNIDDRHFYAAEHWIRGAIEADRRNGMMLHLGRDHALCAELFKRKGDRSKFQEHLGKAIDLFKECGADGWLKKAEEGLATFT